MPHQTSVIASRLLAISLGITFAPLAATSMESTSMTDTLIATEAASAPLPEIATFLPEGYVEANRRAVTVDGEAATLVRYHRADRRNAALGGEHFSTVIAANGRLKGFARMDLALVGGALPSREETHAIAMDFLQQTAPDLIPGLQVSWIEPHDEPVLITGNGRTETQILTGMKVKMRNTADGRWMWVIVGADRKVMVFERDIVWVNFPGHRQTEKWLHDSWLLQKGLTARQS